jgi:hypothetical protein
MISNIEFQNLLLQRDAILVNILDGQGIAEERLTRLIGLVGH